MKQISAGRAVPPQPCHHHASHCCSLCVTVPDVQLSSNWAVWRVGASFPYSFQLLQQINYIL